MTYSRKFAVVTGADASDLYTLLDAVFGVYEGTEYQLKSSHFVQNETNGKYDFMFLFEKEINENAQRDS